MIQADRSTTLIAAVLAATVPGAASASRLADAAQSVCAGASSSEQLVSDALARARAHADLNAIITLNEQGALAAARAIDAGNPQQSCLPLAGVPIVVKDNIHVAGLPSTAGTPALARFVPHEDAPVVARLRAAGAIILAKTQMHELAFGISGYNPAFAAGETIGVRNAYDRSRVAGGSSSGSGAAIGARIVAAGLGTDTGGSVRIPCAFNGCASLRPSIERYPADGIAPISHTRDTAGPMAATVADVELLDRVISGAEAARPAALEGLRLGLVTQMLANNDADTRAVFDRALARLREAGAIIVEIDAPDLADANNAISFPIALYEARDDMMRYLERYRTGVSIEELAAQAVSPDVKGTYTGLVIPGKLPGPDNTVVDAKPIYDQAVGQGRARLQAVYARLFEQHRVTALVFPTVPIVAMPAGPESSSIQNFGLVIQNTDPGSNAGLPGLQIPAGLGPASGLPVGLELDGPAGSDRELIAIGMAIEALLGELLPRRGNPERQSAVMGS
ncbi:MAG: indoleacetamide hydrolase [Burkholderiaceae bacterium]